MELQAEEAKAAQWFLNALGLGMGASDFSQGNTAQSGAYTINMPNVGSGRATGGPVAPGSIHPVVENGPELLRTSSGTYLMMGATGGQVMPIQGAAPGGSGAMAGASGGNVYITVENNGQPANATVKQSRRGNGDMDIKVMLDAVEDHMGKSLVSGKLGKLGQSRYGWQRRGVPVSG
jgi:hypothetical protein